MSVKTVFRVENKKTGLGPYQDEHEITFVLSKNHTGPKYPFVEIDDLCKLRVHGDVFFGFDSFDDVFDWFTSEEIANLYQQGFVISVYKVCDMYVVKSYKQVIFNRDLADKIDVIDFDQIQQTV
jgi:hypothetical protein